MKNFFKKSLALLLTLCFVLSCTALGVAGAEEETYKKYVFEAEESTVKAYSSGGSEIASKSKPDVPYASGSSGNGNCIHFTNGELANVNFTVNVDKAGLYTLSIAYRLNWSYYAKGYLSVNGNETDKTFSTQSTTADNNKDNNRIKSVNFGRVELNAGDNVISLTVTGKAGTVSNTQIMLDKLVLTEYDVDPFKWEAEATPFTVTDSTGMTTTVNKESTWAWSLALGTTGLMGDLSHDLAYFRSGGVGGTVDYTINVPEEGDYGLYIKIRPNKDSYCKFRMLVDNKPIGNVLTSKNDDYMNDIQSVNNLLRIVEVGNAHYTAGEHTITFVMLEDHEKTGFALDYFELGEPIDEASIVPTVAVNTLSDDANKEFDAYQQFRVNANDSTKKDIRVVMLVSEADIADKNSISANITFSDGTKLENYEATTVYTTIDAVADDWTDRYNAAEGYVIFGIVVTGVPSDVTVADKGISWIIN